MADPLFQDLILNEMLDVGALRIKVDEQRGRQADDENFDRMFELEEKAEHDWAGICEYLEFLFFTNNLLASLVADCSYEQVSLRALKQIHRLTTNKIKEITCEQWKKQTSTTIQLVLKQLSRKIEDKGPFDHFFVTIFEYM
ncbi:unnamed protein product [Didymodactylos carnosus]|uniref:Uncharacterized protein n=1 Tax=Didymodactylos carnosus TaxID=1234261 RepID=A0A8S2HTQ9_9BILA|nr:unnamed protein product [Didymodactylos carnosus]CAF3685135.1 unnamed protein product [Didymodactylos carnosus]